MIPRKLVGLDRDKLIAHLQRLQGEDRRLRFGAVVNDEYIANYVEQSCNTPNNKWFGVDGEVGIIAACHIAVNGDDAELGCSVEEDYRGQKVAQAMFDRAVTWLRARGIQEVYMHCLTENGAMKHIAKKNDMTLVSEYGETDATVHVEPPTLMTPLQDAYMDRIALYDMVFREQLRIFKTLHA